MKMAEKGEDWARSMATSEKTFFRHRKLILDTGCSWIHVDANPGAQSDVPEGFSPVRSDPRRLSEEDPRVTQLLKPFADAGCEMSM
jgi:hypothetical protein